MFERQVKLSSSFGQATASILSLHWKSTHGPWVYHPLDVLQGCRPQQDQGEGWEVHQCRVSLGVWGRGQPVTGRKPGRGSKRLNLRVRLRPAWCTVELLGQEYAGVPVFAIKWTVKVEGYATVCHRVLDKSVNPPAQEWWCKSVPTLLWTVFIIKMDIYFQLFVMYPFNPISEVK